VSQLTSKATTVVLNKCAGAITTFNDALGSLSAVSFTLTNSAIAATDVVVVSHKSGGTAGAYICGACSFGAGSCKITIFNVSGGSLSEALVLNFAVIKGVAA
jgi:enolase